jgi:hypothetical protein
MEQIDEIEARLEARPPSSRADAAARPELIAGSDANMPAIVALLNRA